MLNKIVYSSIAVGLTLAGAGIAYVISFEGRLSKLETQIGFISGASSAPNSKLAGDEKSQGIQNSTISAPFFESEKLIRQLPMDVQIIWPLITKLLVPELCTIVKKHA